MNVVQCKRIVALVLPACVILMPSSKVVADVAFYLQREGSSVDTGWTSFVNTIGIYLEVDFEKSAYSPDGSEVALIATNNLQLQLSGEMDGPFVPITFSSNEFNAPGKIFNKALLSGYALVIDALGTVLPRGLGMWIFDDTREWDAAYLVEVTEADGTTWQTVLENQAPRNSHGHENEGFIGAVSTIGIASMRITAIDPMTGTALPDFFETDHWLIACFPRTCDLSENTPRVHPASPVGPLSRRRVHGRGTRVRRTTGITLNDDEAVSLDVREESEDPDDSVEGEDRHESKVDKLRHSIKENIHNRERHDECHSKRNRKCLRREGKNVFQADERGAS